ncbi:MAG TPA: tetratricopeptide repeat protein [Bradyrhizobium sp.]|nr:tetratricopeptide repeat protein [Bradyrhizobium sp.]
MLSLLFVRWFGHAWVQRASASNGQQAGRLEFTLACIAGVAIAGVAGLYVTAKDADVSTIKGPIVGRETRDLAAEDAPAVKRLAAATQTTGSTDWWAPQPQPRSGLPSVEEMIQRLVARLEKNAGDAEGWRTLGWSYLNVGRFSEASNAYAKAIELLPGNAELRTARIEVMLRSSDGKVSAATAKAIEEVLKIDPQNTRARFFAGLAKAQSGDKAAALVEWVDLLAKVKSDEPWLSELKSSINGLERDLGVSAPISAAESKLANSQDVPSMSKNESWLPRVVEKGPSVEDLQAADAMSSADRSAMVHNMVDGLARRLEKSPRDAEGWIKLIRSRIVLGQTEQAKQALTRGTDVFSDDAGQRDRIVAVARELGLSE